MHAGRGAGPNQRREMSADRWLPESLVLDLDAPKATVAGRIHVDDLRSTGCPYLDFSENRTTKGERQMDLTSFLVQVVAGSLGPGADMTHMVP